MPRKKTTAIAKRSKADVFDEQLACAQMAEVQRLAAAHTEDAVRSLVEIATATEREEFPNEIGYFQAVKDDEGQVIRKPYLPGPRSTAAKALLEHAHGRPTQRISRDGGGADTRITVVLQTFGARGEQVEIDVTPNHEEISGGADPPTERVAS